MSERYDASQYIRMYVGRQSNGKKKCCVDSRKWIALAKPYVTMLKPISVIILIIPRICEVDPSNTRYHW